MEKLIQRFEDLSDVWHKGLAEKSAEECKRVAIEFETWVNKDFYRKPFEKTYIRVTPDPTIWPTNGRSITKEELFDHFIEEEYANIQ